MLRFLSFHIILLGLIFFASSPARAACETQPSLLRLLEGREATFVISEIQDFSQREHLDTAEVSLLTEALRLASENPRLNSRELKQKIDANALKPVIERIIAILSEEISGNQKRATPKWFKNKTDSLAYGAWIECSKNAIKKAEALLQKDHLNYDELELFVSNCPTS